MDLENNWLMGKKHKENISIILEFMFGQYLVLVDAGAFARRLASLAFTCLSFHEPFRRGEVFEKRSPAD